MSELLYNILLANWILHSDTFVCNENFQGRKKLIHLVIKIELYPSLHLTYHPKYLVRATHFIGGWGQVKRNAFVSSVDAVIDL